MAYKIGVDIADWLEMMKGSKYFGCTVINLNDLPKVSYKAGIYEYTSIGVVTFVPFMAPALENQNDIQHLIRAEDETGEVAIDVTNITSEGFYVIAPIACTITYMVGYKLVEIEGVISGNEEYTGDGNIQQIVWEKPLPESTKTIILYAISSYGNVAIKASNITKTGFDVKAPINCNVTYVVGYEN